MAPPRRCWRWLGATAVAVFAWAAQASVDINRATALDLQAFKGIGPAVAARVLDARQQGAFKDWPDLMARVHGMGPHKADQLSAQGLTVNGLRYGEVGDPPARPWTPFQPRPLQHTPH